MRTSALLLIAFTATVLAGCAVGPDFRAPQMELPPSWPEQLVLSDDQRTEQQQWWRQFNDPALERLVERAVADNLDIRLQTGRIQEARARLGFARAEQLPRLDAQADAARRLQSGAAFGLPDINTQPNNLFSLSAALNYELDLWGRLAREREAASALLEQNLFGRDAVQLGVITDVVTTYIELLNARRQLRITEYNLELRRKTFNLEEIRFEAGQTDELTLRQAQVELEAIKAQLPAREARVHVLESALGVLVGLSPAELFAEFSVQGKTLEELHLPGHLPSILPAELLQRRPDIRAAQAGLIAATADIGAAQAQRWPRVNLAAMLGTAATELGDLFTAPAETWSLGGSLVGPLLDFGRTRARVETAEARREQAETIYTATVLNAFQEVQQALIIYTSSAARIDAVKVQLDALSRTLHLAELRYREGFIGILEVLDAQRALLGAELAMTEAIRDQLSATATLFKALGGGWTLKTQEST